MGIKGCQHRFVETLIYLSPIAHFADKGWERGYPIPVHRRHITDPCTKHEFFLQFWKNKTRIVPTFLHTSQPTTLAAVRTVSLQVPPEHLRATDLNPSSASPQPLVRGVLRKVRRWRAVPGHHRHEGEGAAVHCPVWVACEAHTRHRHTKALPALIYLYFGVFTFFFCQK